MPIIKPIIGYEPEPDESYDSEIYQETEELEEFESENVVIPSEKEITKTLARAGILNQSNTDDSEADNIRFILSQNGASIEDAVQSISAIASSAKNDSTRLRAAETILSLHGAMDKDGRGTKQPIFNFIIHSENVNMQNVFSPHRERNLTKSQPARLKS